ncbi:hypothetical protein BCR32DRAFT_244381 [Anaeromyces robustus]|uniref:Uncharacterized protein n=1 Tax=Anaeromyces robustus TaxID=1754192 RepID=A0A1Y1X8S2_9FUNG|nr:hypothetical protein BCR32DRAFT_244381 [Anaeromyces robustus]|eukprot:ORX82127.1 hypothetical protein BCR32DRAFT_244381 [Anaeromyces robustus]
MKLSQEYKKRNIDNNEKDQFLEECSNYLISIGSLPVIFSNIKDVYENDDQLLEMLANNDLESCLKYQKQFITNVYVSPLSIPNDILQERIDRRLDDQKYSQSLYIIIFSFTEDIVKYYRAHVNDLNEKQKITICDKIEYVISLICEKVKKRSPTRTLCEKALQIIKTFEEIDDHNMEFSTPDYCFRIPNVSPVTKFLSSKLMNNINKNIKKEENSKEKSFEELRRSRLSDNSNNNNLVCYIEQIWIQVELETETVLLTDVTYPDLSNFFCSSRFGVFKMTLKHISWYGTKNQSSNEKYEEAVRIPYQDINCYSYGFISNEKKNKNDNNQQYGYIMIFLKQEIFKFYPFKIHELQLLLTALYSITGIIPVRQEQQVKALLMKKIDNVRREVLLYLVSQESPWITTSNELLNSLNRLTHESKPQRILEIERLFHSCRMESEVTKETIYYLRKRWHETYSERVRVKILIIIDRLIDRTILTQSDPNFILILKWLEYLEESLHPIKNFEVLNLIQTLIKRAKMIRIKTLTPISINSLTTSFDQYDEFLSNLLYTEKIKEV